MNSGLKEYLEDPFLNRLWRAVRRAGPVRSISLDLTHVCNLRCTGCYYFEEGMDQHQSPKDEAVFDAFLEREKDRGTNFITIVGGEPSLAINRIKKIYDNFYCSVATNGIRKIPYEGLENLPIGVSVWGEMVTDRTLRGGGKIDVFQKALRNYHNDSRAFWYYTVAPGYAGQVEHVVERCIENGNKVLFNYYSDLSEQGGDLDDQKGFKEVRHAIDRMIRRYPEHILMTAYFNEVISRGQLYGDRWGYDVCTNLSTNNPVNSERLKTDKPYNPHFRAYNADFATTRRCCTGVSRDCDSCHDTWEHFSWVMVNLKKHLGSKQEFTQWLTTMYLFYFINRITDYAEGVELLPEIQRRVSRSGHSRYSPGLVHQTS